MPPFAGPVSKIQATCSYNFGALPCGDGGDGGEHHHRAADVRLNGDWRRQQPQDSLADIPEIHKIRDIDIWDTLEPLPLPCTTQGRQILFLALDQSTGSMRMLINRYGHMKLLLRNKPLLWPAVFLRTRRTNESNTLDEDIIERLVSGRSLS